MCGRPRSWRFLVLVIRVSLLGVSFACLLGDSLFHESLKLVLLVFKKIHRVILHVGVDPALANILLSHEVFYLIRCRIWIRLAIVVRHVSLPVGVYKRVAQVFEHVKFAGRPLVQIHRLNLADVRAETPVLTCTEPESALGKNDTSGTRNGDLPEQRRQINTPRLMLAHRGVFALQSAQTKF